MFNDEERGQEVSQESKASGVSAGDARGAGGDAAGGEGGWGLSEALRQLSRSVMHELRTDFWRTCDKFIIHLASLVLLLIAILELLARHAAELGPVE